VKQVKNWSTFAQVMTNSRKSYFFLDIVHMKLSLCSMRTCFPCMTWKANINIVI